MQDMMGGFFGLELPEFDNFPYREGPCCAYLSSGRAAFECLLMNVPRPACVWAPRFLCDTMLQATARLGIPVKRYACTAQLAPILPEVQENELVLLVDYFGLTGDAVDKAAALLPGRCVVDATTALYTPPLPEVPTIYSPRKFSGVPDGGVLCSPFPITRLPVEQQLSSASSLHLLERIESGASAAARNCDAAEDALAGPARRMSPLTRRLLSSIDFEEAAARRLENYSTLHRALGSINRLQLPDTPLHAPMCYPLVCGIPDLRDALIDAGIALPLYWPEVIEATDACDTENRLARTLLPLPLDQRYKKSDIERILTQILG